MTILYANDFSSGLGGGWLVSPIGGWGVSSGWADALGDGVGNTWLKRSLPTANYLETLCYSTASSGDNWGCAKLRCSPTGATYDADGFGVLFRSSGFNGHQLEIFRVGGTATPSTGYVTTLPYPHDSASAIKLGLYSPSNTEIYVYANGILVMQAVGCTPQTNSNVMIGCFNSSNSFFDYVTVTDEGIPTTTSSHWGRNLVKV